ncbi:hypothetical protein FZX15_09120 [Brucella suis bv. 1]|nr:hypothetical protein FZX15_09120 [Brucella suis bv. 1]
MIQPGMSGLVRFCRKHFQQKCETETLEMLWFCPIALKIPGRVVVHCGHMGFPILFGEVLDRKP